MTNQPKITNISHNCTLIGEHFECSGTVNNPKWLHAYQDSGGVWTIGIGTIRYPNGKKVQKGDVITVQEAYDFYNYEIGDAILKVDSLTRDDIDQNMFDALVDFIYNVGWPAYKTSHVRQYINEDPKNFKKIVPELLKWRYDNGKYERGLLRRRQCLAYLMVYGELKFEFDENDPIV